MAAIEAALDKAGRERRGDRGVLARDDRGHQRAARGPRRPDRVRRHRGLHRHVALGRQDRPQLYRLCAARPAPLAPDELRFGAPERMTPDGPLIELTDRRGNQTSRTGLPRPSPKRSRSRCFTPTATPNTSRPSATRWRRRCRTPTCRSRTRSSARSASTSARPPPRSTPRSSPLLASYLRRLAGRAQRSRPPRAHDHAVQRRPDRRRGGRRPRLVDGAVGAGRRRRRRGVRRAQRRRRRRAVPRHGRHVVRRVRGRRRRRPGAERAARSPGARWRCRCSRCTPSAPAAARSRGATRGGALRVGPRSAGADPGPACYGRGGTEPTVTDANLVLGYLSADAPLAAASSSTATRPSARSPRWPSELGPRRRRVRRGDPPRRRRRDDPRAARRHRRSAASTRAATR